MGAASGWWAIGGGLGQGCSCSGGSIGGRRGGEGASRESGGGEGDAGK